jgi:hypothetical protein
MAQEKYQDCSEAKKSENWGSIIHETDRSELYERLSDVISPHTANRLQIGRINRVLKDDERGFK